MRPDTKWPTDLYGSAGHGLGTVGLHLFLSVSLISYRWCILFNYTSPSFISLCCAAAQAQCDETLRFVISQKVACCQLPASEMPCRCPPHPVASQQSRKPEAGVFAGAYKQRAKVACPRFRMSGLKMGVMNDILIWVPLMVTLLKSIYHWFTS